MRNSKRADAPGRRLPRRSSLDKPGLGRMAGGLVLATIVAVGIGVVGDEGRKQKPAAGAVTLGTGEALVLAAGEGASAVFTVEVENGYHVQANPVPFPYLIPTRLEVQEAAGFRTELPLYPPGKPHPLQGSPDTLQVYDGVFEIVLPLRASETAAPGAYTLSATLHYQRCDDRLCYRPTTVSVVLPLRIREGERAP